MSCGKIANLRDYKKFKYINIATDKSPNILPEKISILMEMLTNKNQLVVARLSQITGVYGFNSSKRNVELIFMAFLCILHIS